MREWPPKLADVQAGRSVLLPCAPSRGTLARHHNLLWPAVQLSTCRCGTATAIRKRPRARQLCPVAVTIAHFKLRAARKLTPHCAVVHSAVSSQFQHSPFIRACYPRLFEMLMQPRYKDVMLIGTPGVGKVGLST